MYYTNYPPVFNQTPPFYRSKRYKTVICANITQHNNCNDNCNFAHPSDPTFLNLLYKHTNLSGDSVSVYINKMQTTIYPKSLYLKCLIEAIGYEKQQLYKEAYTKYKESIPLIDNEKSNVDYIILKRDINSKIEQLEIIEMQKNSNENINTIKNDNIIQIIKESMKDIINIKEIIISALTDEELKNLIMNNFNTQNFVINLIKDNNNFKFIIKDIIKELLNDEEFYTTIKDKFKLPNATS